MRKLYLVATTNSVWEHESAKIVYSGWLGLVRVATVNRLEYEAEQDTGIPLKVTMPYR
ncbi:MAG: hypothetical protein ACFCU9_00475 [Cyanophyceae cyanobacterium]